MLATLYITGLTGITTRYLLHTKNRNNVFDETQQARVLEVVRISACCHPRNFNSKVLAFLELQICGLKHGNYFLWSSGWLGCDGLMDFTTRTKITSVCVVGWMWSGEWWFECALWYVVLTLMQNGICMGNWNLFRKPHGM